MTFAGQPLARVLRLPPLPVSTSAIRARPVSRTLTASSWTHSPVRLRSTSLRPCLVVKQRTCGSTVTPPPLRAALSWGLLRTRRSYGHPRVWSGSRVWSLPPPFSSQTAPPPPRRSRSLLTTTAPVRVSSVGQRTPSLPLPTVPRNSPLPRQPSRSSRVST